MVIALLRGLEKLSDKFYSNFLLRDLVYISSGVLILFMMLVCTDMTQLFMSSPDFLKVFSIVACYYIGLINQELMVSLGIFRMFPKVKGKQFVEQETETIIKIIKLINVNPEKSINDSFKRAERIFTIKNIMTAFGSALLSSMLILIARGYQDHITYSQKVPLMTRGNYLVTIMVMAGLLFGAILSNRRKAKVQDKLLDALTQLTQSDN